MPPEDIKIERLPNSAFIRTASATEEYQDVNKLHPLLDAIGYGSGVALVGPKGIGKSLAIASYAVLKNIPLVTFDCSEDVRRAQLLGAYVIRGNETPFILGPIPTAIEIANETGACVLVFEEVNTLTPQMQKVLNALCDFRRRVEIPEAKAVYALNPGARLLIAGTMNHSGYGGVYDLNEDLKSRLNLVPLSYPASARSQDSGCLPEAQQPPADGFSDQRLAHARARDAPAEHGVRLEHARPHAAHVQRVQDRY